MEIKPLSLSGVFEMAFQPKIDQRGYFLRSYDQTIFVENGLNTSWVQENEALSVKKGTVRGLHFQKPPNSEIKLVRVVKGAILDAFVDIRRHSPTYGRWGTIELTQENHKAVYIPKGFAHGYCSLTDDSVVLYKVDARYSPESEGGLRWNDSDIGIPWPVTYPNVSAKDAALPHLRDFVTPFE